ncbi:PKD domain-containing protein, partial [Candidatus Pacearchaeota archaeon]|nr:PKD domain-containing protein [Candidatus Pacearchaeota archaeon]
FEWDFGDGRSSTEESPEHTYFMAGTYNGTFTITDQYGNTWSTTFTIYVYDWDLTGEEEGTHVSFTDKCYRVAIKPNHGVGIVPWGIGGDFPFPEAEVGTVKGLNKANQAISLILDNRTGRFYRIGVKEVWQDKVDRYGNGTDINSEIRIKEQVGKKGEEDMIEHVESHIHVRPNEESDKNRSGYTSLGFLENHRVNLKLFANGDSVTPIAKLDNVAQYGDYIFGKRVENKRLQLQIETTTSSFKITRFRQILNNIDKVTPEGIGGIRSETNYQELFKGKDLWITRDSKNPLMNRAVGTDVSGSYDSLVTGPDAKSNSALSFLGGDTLTATLSQKSLPSTVSFWLGDLTTVGDIFKFDTAGADDFIIRITQPGATFVRLTNDAAWTHDVQLSWVGSGWVLIAITLDSTNLYVYENGVLKGIIPTPAWLTTYGGVVDMVGAAVVSMFDIRRIPRQLIPDVLSWYYDDVVNNSGSGGTLPIMR